MFSLENLDATDFCFNNNYLSEFEAEIAWAEQPSISGLPTIETVTEKIMGRDGEFEVNESVQPRTWITPIKINNLNRLDDIKAWLLSSRKSQWFHYLNDGYTSDYKKIKCKIDGTIDFARLGVQYNNNLYEKGDVSVVELKFIAYDPYLYESFPTNIIVNNNFTNIPLYTQGNVESYPLIKIVGNGDIVGALNGYNISIDGIVDYVYIDMQTMKVYKDINTNMYPNYKGVSFVKLLPKTINVMSITSGNVTQVEIVPRNRWV